MIKKQKGIILSIILFLTFIQSTQCVEQVVTPTSLNDRAKVFETYYLDNPDNDDKGVFEHVRKWHEEDFRALFATLEQPDSKDRFQRICHNLQRSFETRTVSFSKIALSYLLYSYVCASEYNSSRTPEELDKAIKLTSIYIEETAPADYLPGSDNVFHKMGCDKFMGPIKVLDLDSKKLHWLPYVSRSGLASYRTLNNCYGMRAPTLGIPLTRIAPFDGNLDTEQDDFARHETNHGGFYDSESPKHVSMIYAHYRRANDIVRRIEDPQTLALCDYFLYQLGHEHGFGIHKDYGAKDYPPPIVCYTTLAEVGDYIVKQIESTFLRMSQSLPLDSYWGSLSTCSWVIGNETIRCNQSHDDYYATTSRLVSFVKPGTSQLFSLVEIITGKGLSKRNPLQKHEITDPFVPNLLKVLESERIPRTEFDNFVFSMGLQPYNVLVGDEKYFTQKGFQFSLWDGDKFQSERVLAFFIMVRDTFMREVSPHMKNLDWKNHRPT